MTNMEAVIRHDRVNDVLLPVNPLTITRSHAFNAGTPSRATPHSHLNTSNKITAGQVSNLKIKICVNVQAKRRYCVVKQMRKTHAAQSAQLMVTDVFPLGQI